MSRKKYIGDRWTLLLLRDCFFNVRQFDAFHNRLGITRHVLADRLKKLVAAGILEKAPYQTRPTRYEYKLTKKGFDLYSILMALMNWGDQYMAGEGGPPVIHEHKGHGHQLHPVMTCGDCGEPVRAEDVRAIFLTAEKPG